MLRSKQIFVGCRVEGSHGPLVANPDPKIKKRVHSKVIGTIFKVNEPSLFILINSIAGVGGQLTKDFVLSELTNYWPLFLIVFVKS